MKVRLTEKQIIEIVKKLHEYRKELDTEFPDSKNFKEVKTFKELLVEDKVEELIEKLLKSEKTFTIETLVVEGGNKSIFLENRLLLEWEKYKKIPKTNLTYRYDPGQGKPGMEDHIHVYLGTTKNQVYAINKSGTPHDGSKAKLSSKEIKFLKTIGFEPPKDGILEWISLSPNKVYVAYKRFLLSD